MTDRDPDEPIEDVVEETVGDVDDVTTRREAVELELEERGRSDEGAEVEIDEVLPEDSPAEGVVDDDVADPPEPNEPA
jgi:hypothetical protein